MIVVSSYRILVFAIGLLLTAGDSYEIHLRKSQSVQEAPSKKLEMDEAYLIMSNTNNSNASVFLGNAVICEKCDLEEMVTVLPNSNVTYIVKTDYAYDFDVRSLPSKALLQCSITSYKFSEHGTYLFEVKQSTEDGNIACSIVQIGESSHYWSPIIVGLVVWIVFIVIIQLYWHIYHNHNFRNSILNIFKQRLTKNDSETMPLVSPLVSSENLRQAEHNVSHSETDNDANLSLVKSTDQSNKTINSNSAKSKRFQALDVFRGLVVMVMIFVNYGGMFLFSFFSLQICFAIYRWWL